MSLMAGNSSHRDACGHNDDFINAIRGTRRGKYNAIMKMMINGNGAVSRWPAAIEENIHGFAKEQRNVAFHANRSTRLD